MVDVCMKCLKMVIVQRVPWVNITRSIGGRICHFSIIISEFIVHVRNFG